MFNKNSIYALNKKDPDAIVYPSATGQVVRITRADFPSEEEFLAFKAWSDENFHKEDNRDVVEGKHLVSIDDISESALAVPAIDTVMERQHDRAVEMKKASDMVVKLKDKLTDAQFRRLWMYEVEKKSMEEIAEIEGVSVPAVFYALQYAHKKISKKFSDGQ